MATRGSITSNYIADAYCKLEWKLESQSAASNSSNISWSFELHSLHPTKNTVSGNVPVSIQINGVYYSATINAGSYPIGTYGIASGSATIPHNTDGTKSFSYSFYVDGANSVLGSMSASGTSTLDEIFSGAKVVSAPNFTDEDSPTITYSNPAGESATSLEVCISYDGYAIDVPYRAVSKTGTSYTFVFTEAEKATLYSRVRNGNTTTVKFYIKAVVRGQSYLHSLTRVFTIANPEPILNPVVGDIYEKTKALTGDGFTLVKYHSIVAFNSGAEAVKGAAIASQMMVNGSNVFYDTPSAIIDAKVDNNIFDFTVTDSRGLTTQKRVEANMIPYIPLTASLKINSFTPSGDMSFTISGKYYAGSFGAQDNSMSLKVELQDYSGGMVSSIDLGTIEPTVDELGNYSYSHTLESLDHEKNYTVRILVADALTPAISLSTVAAPIPIFDWGKEDFNFNVPVSIQGAPIADFVTEIGQEAMGSNGIWYWRKWNSGRAECYGCRNYGNTGVSTAWGNLFRSNVFTQDLPLGLFKSAPESIQITLAQGSYGGWIVTHEQSAPSQSASGSFMIVRPASANISQAYISFNVIGRWK